MESKTIQQLVNSYSFKMIIVTFLTILLLIPSFIIQDIIQDRLTYSGTVKKELYAQWGGKQVIAGPVLNVPYLVKATEEGSQSTEERHGVIHFLPETLQADGVISPEKRNRGIYEVVVYEGKIKLKGTFGQPDLSQTGVQNAIYNWDAAYFTIGISDMRGIRNLPELLLNGQHCKVEPGVGDNDLFRSGITIRTSAAAIKQSMNFEIDLVLNGSEDLSMEALGKSTTVNLQSKWAEPSFTGSFLPAKRQVADTGFSAEWLVTHLNRNFPQQWADQKFNTHEAKLGVELLIPIDHYQKSMRSVKYAFLFIALNFIVFLFIEIRSKRRIHPFQYSLVAFALLIFYALLTSISEQIGFNVAYFVSALSVTLLTSWYAYTILREIKLASWVTLLQTGLYLFLFAILQLQDYAMLVGSVGLFVILAIVMRASQQIKWYAEE